MKRISLGYNAVGEGVANDVLSVLWSGQYSPGPLVRRFETEFAAKHNASHGVFVNSGTDALRLSLLALKEKHGWPDGAGVAVPALTFVATINVVLQAGLRPYFVDVGMTDYLMNPDNLEWRLKTGGDTSGVVAVMPVHLFGRSCSPRIYEIAKARNLRVLEDSCETILNPIKGDVSCHSTYMAHHVTTGVGGMALTNDPELNLLIRSYANHGRDTDYLPGYRQGTDITKRFKFDRVGYSCRGTEFEAALGLSQMAGLADSVRARQAVFYWLAKALGSFPDLVVHDLGEGNSAFVFPIVIREYSDVDKHDLCKHLEDAGIETRDMMPITNQPCYKGLVNEDDFTVARWINRGGFYVPCNQGMTADDVRYIATSIGGYLDRRTKKG